MDAGERIGTVVLILDTGVEEACTCLDGRRVDLALVDELGRLHLAARRAGATMVLRQPSPRLAELLELVGLDGLIEGGSGLEALGQAEEPEELGVEEVLPGGDLPP